MTYRLGYRGPCYDAHFDRPDEETMPARWIVERVLGEGEAYTMGSFRERGPAIALLSLCASTIEAEMGAVVEFDRFSVNEAS